MTQPGSDSTNDHRSGANPLVLALLSTLAFVALLAMMMVLNDKLEDLQHRLQQRAPAGHVHLPGDGFGIEIADAQTVYVPVYSHIYSDGGEVHLLETTLSIRNSDPKRPIDITSVRYYDTKGNPVQEYAPEGLQLGPLETTEFLVKKTDIRGGSGANFIVAWKASEPVYEPIVEAVMVGLNRHQSISFKSFGRPLIERVE
jgi:hypothetical protein